MSPDAFFALHEGLPRQGPGSDASTLRALGAVPKLPAKPRVLDLGCGPGQQTLALARTLQTKITAIDSHQPFLDELHQRAAKARLSGLIETRCASMDALDEPLESADLIWSEGAAYCIGVSRALELWRPILRPGGSIAFTEATWLTGDPPAEAALFWQGAYPEITTVAGNIARAEGAGYQVTATFPLPDDSWWAEYYTPLENRIQTLHAGGDIQAGLRVAIEATEQEIELFWRFHSAYGYVFYVCGKPAAA